jgi:hypothetical protein
MSKNAIDSESISKAAPDTAKPKREREAEKPKPARRRAALKRLRNPRRTAPTRRNENAW